MENETIFKKQNTSLDDTIKDFFISKLLESEKDEELGCKKYTQAEMDLILDFVLNR